jgi:glutamyl-tRNA synthetase
MEDLNIVRLKPGAIEQVYEDFKWLGLDWDEGAGLHPKEVANLKTCEAAQFYQSNRQEVYEQAFQLLESKGLVYPCSCSRKDIQMAQSAPHIENELCYPGTCRNRWGNESEAASYKGQAPSWRFKVSEEVTKFEDHFMGPQKSMVAQWSGDFVIAQSRHEIAYQLAVVVDDASQGVNWVIRGNDLLMSSHRQILLQQALGYPSVDYLHLPLVIGPDGKRLAKRHGDWKISILRAHGYSPEKVLGLLAWTLGQCAYGDDISLQELFEGFDWSKVGVQNFVISDQVRKDYKL